MAVVICMRAHGQNTLPQAPFRRIFVFFTPGGFLRAVMSNSTLKILPHLSKVCMILPCSFVVPQAIKYDKIIRFYSY